MSTKLLDAVPLTTLSGVGAAISDKLSRLGIHNLQDLLFIYLSVMKIARELHPLPIFFLNNMPPLKALSKPVRLPLGAVLF